MGSRQDLAFDGCVPLFWDRIICLDFLRGYIQCPKSENVLDKSLYTLLRCNEFVALLRVNTLVVEVRILRAIPLAFGPVK